ncbi:MAG: FUSC family protein [Silvibacterium sp.]|nr:FUSC family protein [Silvibacterium sp.]
MATATLTLARYKPVAWFWDFLRDELAPYPGRGALVARMVVSASLVMLVTMVFQIPYGAFAAIYAFTASRENPDATLKDVQTTVFGYALGTAYVLIGAIFFSGEPVIRFAWVLCTLFVMFFFLRAVANYTVAVRFGYLVVITIPLWDQIIPTHRKVANTLWAILALTISNLITLAVELVYAHLHQIDTVAVALADRLRCTAWMLRSWSAGITDPAREEQLTRLAILGTSRMRLDLLRSVHTPEMTQELGAVIALVGRLVDTAANLTHFSPQPSSPDSSRLNQLAARIDALVSALLTKRTPPSMELSPETDTTANVPLLLEMERTVSLITAVLNGSKAASDYGPATSADEEPGTGFFHPDAFSNSDYIRFAIRGSLSAVACYVAYNLVAWPGISTSVTTCFLTALTTVGASRQKQLLRYAGALVGGMILGHGAQLFVLPGIESISGFLILFLAVTIPAAWISASGPRLSYFGVQMALAFYLINLQEFKFQTSLSIARDRLGGVFLGLLAMWLIFDQLWEASAIVAMRRTFVSSLQSMANLMREPLSSDQHVAIERSLVLRETINGNFDKLRQQADGVMLEFGPSRAQDIAERTRILHWQLDLRVLFLARVALLKYRLRLPGFELQEPIIEAQEVFDTGIGERLDRLAGLLQSTPVPELHQTPLAPILEKAIHDCCAVEPPDPLAGRLRSFVPLCRRVESLVSSLEQEITQRLSQEEAHPSEAQQA